MTMPESPQFIIPAFPSQAEEADWFDSHQDLIVEWFATAAESGTCKSGVAAARARANARSEDSACA